MRKKLKRASLEAIKKQELDKNNDNQKQEINKENGNQQGNLQSEI
jgi:hypothetical protein